jgi:hypothetical protein
VALLFGSRLQVEPGAAMRLMVITRPDARMRVLV